MVLRINNCETIYMKDMYIGQLVYRINLSINGYEEKVDELVDFCMSYKRILLEGDVFEQNDDLSDFCKKIQKNNPLIKIIIKTDGKRRPVKFNAIKNADYLVNLKLKKSGEDYKERINDKAIEWFNKNDSKFIFIVEEEDDLDEVDQIVSNYLISKQQVFIENKCDNFEEVNNKLFFKSYNIYIRLGQEFY